jgi:hypothetical protein
MGPEIAAGAPIRAANAPPTATDAVRRKNARRELEPIGELPIMGLLPGVVIHTCLDS